MPSRICAPTPWLFPTQKLRILSMLIGMSSSGHFLAPRWRSPLLMRSGIICGLAGLGDSTVGMSLFTAERRAVLMFG